jgi:FMN phosphatase YigB (HAD superfamily)
VGLSSEVEDRYLARHRLAEGVAEVLENPPDCVDACWCLSNDVSEWSKKLREGHNLSARFDGYLVSGEVRSRKPDAAIYASLLAQLRRPAGDCVLVDDRPKNLDAAKLLGFRTVLFGRGDRHPSVETFAELRQFLVTHFPGD